MTKQPRVKINGHWFPVPQPWYVAGHPIRTTIRKQIVVDRREALGSSDYAMAEFEFRREFPNLEGFMALALHEALERINDGLELELAHERIMQISECLGPFVCQWFYAQLEASEEKPPETP